ncbi:hypothetical protein AB0873_10950 [Micromonospora sp. NPDC047707]|uniref:hypothetical protein n=1 Tax=Micromonospora sp. NPDC047707 TaxID=3154498 RepID=UPI003451AEA9
MLDLVYSAVVFVVIPSIMIAMLMLGFYVARRVSRDFRLSAMAGLCAGLVGFAIYVVASFSRLRSPELALDGLPRFHWIPSIIGFVVGFSVLLLVRFFRLTAGLVGLMVLFLTFAGSTSAFSYFFASPLRGFAIFLALSAMFGMLLNVLLFPEPIREVLRS